MKLIDEEQSYRADVLLIECECGTKIRHRADRWRVSCPCGKTEEVIKIRQQDISVEKGQGYDVEDGPPRK
jgi:hypothetical protein